MIGDQGKAALPFDTLSFPKENTIQFVFSGQRGVGSVLDADAFTIKKEGIKFFIRRGVKHAGVKPRVEGGRAVVDMRSFGILIEKRSF
jgi:hypothetical protein